MSSGGGGIAIGSISGTAGAGGNTAERCLAIVRYPHRYAKRAVLTCTALLAKIRREADSRR